MAVEGDANEEAQSPSPLERLSVLGWPHFPATVNPACKADFYALQKPRS